MAACVSNKGKFILEAPAKSDHDNTNLNWWFSDPNLCVKGKNKYKKLQLLISVWKQMELGQQGENRRRWGALLGGTDGSHGVEGD